jgi:hypothetical protein
MVPLGGNSTTEQGILASENIGHGTISLYREQAS